MTPKYSCFPKTTHIIFHSSQEPRDRPDIHSAGRGRAGAGGCCPGALSGLHHSWSLRRCSNGNCRACILGCGSAALELQGVWYTYGLSCTDIPIQITPVEASPCSWADVSLEHQPQTPLAVTVQSISPQCMFLFHLFSGVFWSLTWMFCFSTDIMNTSCSQG